MVSPYEHNYLTVRVIPIIVLLSTIIIYLIYIYRHGRIWPSGKASSRKTQGWTHYLLGDGTIMSPGMELQHALKTTTSIVTAISRAQQYHNTVDFASVADDVNFLNNDTTRG